MSKVVYIAGPMRGIPEFNFPAFFEAEAQLIAAGYKVINPASNGPQSLNGHLTADAEAVASCDLVAVLPGWQDSEGATLEFRMANYLGVPVYLAESLYITASPSVYATRVALDHPGKAETHLVHDGNVVLKRENPVIPEPEGLGAEVDSPDSISTSAIIRQVNPAVAAPRLEQFYGGALLSRDRGIKYGPSSRFPQVPFAEEWVSPKDYPIPERPPFTRFEELLQEMQELHDRKKSDYTAGNADILMNYRKSGDLAHIGVVKSIFARLCEKVIRISSILEKGGDTQVKDESIKDTCLDLAIISLLLRIAFEEADNGKQQQKGNAGTTA